MIVSYTNKKATAEYEKYNKKYPAKNSSWQNVTSQKI